MVLFVILSPFCDKFHFFLSVKAIFGEDSYTKISVRHLLALTVSDASREG